MHYGTGAYDWAYIAKDGSLLAKLTGLDLNTGYLTWDILDINSFSAVRIAATGKFVYFGSTTSKLAAAKALADSVQEIDGHFMHYDSGAYDWMYVTTDSSLAAKLTGLDPKTDYLTWGVLDKESLGNIKINASASAIEFDAQSSTNNDFTVTYTQGDMPHATAHFNSLTASMAKSTAALVQAIYTINSFLYTDPSVTDLATFKDRKAQVDKALAVLQKHTQNTLALTGEPDKASSLKRGMLLSRTDYLAEEINAIVNDGNVNKPVASLMNELNINAKEAKKILDGAMNELSTNYQAEASWWDLAARAANLVSNTAQLTCTVLGATLAAGPATVAAGGLTIAQTAVLAVTSAEALVKTSQAGVELIIGEDVDIEGTLVTSARDGSAFINDFVAIDKLFNEPDELASNMIYVAGKGANLLWDKKVTILDQKMEVTDKDMIKVFEEVEEQFENQILALLPGVYHMPDGSTATILDMPEKAIQIFGVLSEEDKVDDVKKITLSCPSHQKVLGDVCVNKVCHIDDYNCPECAEDEELKFKDNGTGYCEKIPAEETTTGCTPPSCCADAPQACGE
ncbi:MAG: hypothetical protein U9O83_07180, partial [Campylobacterota bacterium]|nr:hypothetical protein [Campylobacterota bacterium]